METLKVHRGDNIMDSCFQYAIVDEEGRKLLNVKIYDKFGDLLSRENTQQVGSRVKEMVSSNKKPSVFDRRISKA